MVEKKMDDTREEISRLIKQISEKQKELSSLSSSQLESLVAELSAQHKKVIEIQRSIAPRADLLLSIRDQRNIISKYAFEIKQAQKLVDTSAIEQFRKYINKLGVERGFLVTNVGGQIFDLDKWACLTTESI